MSITADEAAARARRNAHAAARPGAAPLPTRDARARGRAPSGGDAVADGDGGAPPVEPAPGQQPRQHHLDLAHLRGGYVRVVKPFVDRAAALTVLTVMAVPMLVVAAAVRLTMGSPVLFRQQRIGLGGTPFTVLKFRTMHPDRRVSDVAVPVDRRRTHKSTDDPRHTPVGRFLRKWSLDELPQLINVVRGEMSVIGPRPELVSVVASYSDPELHDRHLVRPGLTGLWQVSARGDGLMHENGEWDLEYVRTVSLRTDAKILVKTPLALLADNTGE